MEQTNKLHLLSTESRHLILTTRFKHCSVGQFKLCKVGGVKSEALCEHWIGKKYSKEKLDAFCQSHLKQAGRGSGQSFEPAFEEQLT